MNGTADLEIRILLQRIPDCKGQKAGRVRVVEAFYNGGRWSKRKHHMLGWTG
ncbi:hypothetical protein [Thermococcus zilligii]|uniref:hypothetical protein n=1 Tax=Thermococcus zilligii TaxID=54076 RepID=UPI000AEF8505|nr:hypothetical protein [Thermococcus zilligii]